jgi:hypothetical protein
VSRPSFPKKKIPISERRETASAAMSAKNMMMQVYTYICISSIIGLTRMAYFIVVPHKIILIVYLISYRDGIPFTTGVLGFSKGKSGRAEIAQGLVKVHRTFSHLALFCLHTSNCIHPRKS